MYHKRGLSKMEGEKRGEMEKKMEKCLLVTVAGLLNSSPILLIPQDTCVLSPGAFLNLTFENTTSKNKHNGQKQRQTQSAITIGRN